MAKKKSKKKRSKPHSTGANNNKIFSWPAGIANISPLMSHDLAIPTQAHGKNIAVARKNRKQESGSKHQSLAKIIDYWNNHASVLLSQKGAIDPLKRIFRPTKETWRYLAPTMSAGECISSKFFDDILRIKQQCDTYKLPVTRIKLLASVAEMCSAIMRHSASVFMTYDQKKTGTKIAYIAEEYCYYFQHHKIKFFILIISVFDDVITDLGELYATVTTTTSVDDETRRYYSDFILLLVKKLLHYIDILINYESFIDQLIINGISQLTSNNEAKATSSEMISNEESLFCQSTTYLKNLRRRALVARLIKTYFNVATPDLDVLNNAYQIACSKLANNPTGMVAARRRVIKSQAQTKTHANINDEQQSITLCIEQIMFECFAFIKDNLHTPDLKSLDKKAKTNRVPYSITSMGELQKIYELSINWQRLDRQALQHRYDHLARWIINASEKDHNIVERIILQKIQDNFIQIWRYCTVNQQQKIQCKVPVISPRRSNNRNNTRRHKVFLQKIRRETIEQKKITDAHQRAYWRTNCKLHSTINTQKQLLEQMTIFENISRLQQVKWLHIKTVFSTIIQWLVSNITCNEQQLNEMVAFFNAVIDEASINYTRDIAGKLHASQPSLKSRPISINRHKVKSDFNDKLFTNIVFVYYKHCQCYVDVNRRIKDNEMIEKIKLPPLHDLQDDLHSLITDDPNLRSFYLILINFIHARTTAFVDFVIARQRMSTKRYEEIREQQKNKLTLPKTRWTEEQKKEIEKTPRYKIYIEKMRFLQAYKKYYNSKDVKILITQNVSLKKRKPQNNLERQSPARTNLLSFDVRAHQLTRAFSTFEQSFKDSIINSTTETHNKSILEWLRSFYTDNQHKQSGSCQFVASCIRQLKPLCPIINKNLSILHQGFIADIESLLSQNDKTMIQLFGSSVFFLLSKELQRDLTNWNRQKIVETTGESNTTYPDLDIFITTQDPIYQKPVEISSMRRYQHYRFMPEISTHNWTNCTIQNNATQDEKVRETTRLCDVTLSNKVSIPPFSIGNIGFDIKNGLFVIRPGANIHATVRSLVFKTLEKEPSYDFNNPANTKHIHKKYDQLSALGFKDNEMRFQSNRFKMSNSLR